MLVGNALLFVCMHLDDLETISAVPSPILAGLLEQIICVWYVNNLPG